MSEHWEIKGKADGYGSNFENNFNYCQHCKRHKKNLIISLHSGAISEWMTIKCPTCKKTISASELESKRIKDDKKCYVCKKPTNWYDSVCHIWKKKYIQYVCSNKCYNKQK